MIAMLFASFAAGCGPALDHQVEGADVHFAWSVDDGILIGELSAPTDGWVGVGFNARPQLGGSVLILGSARPDGPFSVVEHVAQPPEHPDRAALGGTAGLLESTAEEVGGRTIVRFRWRVQTGDSFTEGLVAGQPVHLTLAWSHEDDFGHHSARRTLVSTRL